MKTCLGGRSTNFFGMETVEFNSASFWVESLGSETDPALVLIHSGIASAHMWDPLVVALSVGHHVIRYDCQEFGRTTTENVVFSDVDDLLAVMAGTGAERATLIGAHRGGGFPEVHLNRGEQMISDRLDELLAQGDHDLSPARAGTSYLLAVVPNAAEARFPDSAHSPCVERPAEFIRVVGAWLNENGL